MNTARQELLKWLEETTPKPPEPVMKESPLPGQVLQIVNFREDYSGETKEDRQTTTSIFSATSITSEVIKEWGKGWGAEGRHKPVLDIDMPVKVVESSTPGHHHLYIDKEMSWEDYELLLRVLGVVGILEPGYVTASIKRKHTSVRLPWVKKPDKKRPW